MKFVFKFPSQGPDLMGNVVVGLFKAGCVLYFPTILSTLFCIRESALMQVGLSYERLGI